MGLLAHKFSQTKLQLLESGRQSFDTALKCLPLPYMSTEGGFYDEPDDSPTTPEFHHSTLAVQSLIQSSEVPQTPGGPMPKFVPSISMTSFYSTASPEKSMVTSMPEAPGLSENGYRDGVERMEQISDTTAPSSQQLEPPATPATHKSRLSRVLSHPQGMQEELVPSPLFSRIAKQATVRRPLPPLPFNHNPNSFKTQGTRIFQDPFLRRTAVQTLIARYEGILPLPPSTPFPSPTQQSAPETPGILTPRFHMIRDAFSPDPHNQALEAYLDPPRATATAASLRLTRYNDHLADFAAQLRKHIACVEAEIEKTYKVQAERAATKALGSKQRLASFWSLEPSDKTPCPKERRTQARAQLGETTSAEEGACQSNGEDGAKGRAKRERIQQLRRQGWLVRKENHGYKGVAFYDELARRVEAELRLA
jgi:hypothetical protein